MTAVPSTDNGAGGTLVWIRRNPVTTGLIAAVVLTLIYFFGFVKIFANGHISTSTWAWQAWTPETNYEHGPLIPLITAFLIWYKRDKLRVAKIDSSKWGWLFVGAGIFLFFVGARTLQGRIALTAFPFILFGIVLYAWGKEVARILLFPIAFLLFMVPLNFLTQATTKLQFIETGAASAICNLMRIGVYTVGTTINAANESFHFTIDEGCSGIRSLMAIAMLSALYAHFTQDRIWKKLALFAAAFVFALVGNTGRLVSIMVMARFFGQDLAGGPYHWISGYLSFPFALAAMYLFGKLLTVGSKKGSEMPLATETAL